MRFPPYANAALNEAVSAKAEVKNLYRHKAADAPDATELEDEVDEALDRAPSPYDSHPAPKERFELVRRLDAPTPENEDSEAKAWSVFEGRRALEQQLTAELVDRVRTAIDVAA